MQHFEIMIVFNRIIKNTHFVLKHIFLLFKRILQQINTGVLYKLKKNCNFAVVFRTHIACAHTRKHLEMWGILIVLVLIRERKILKIQIQWKN